MIAETEHQRRVLRGHGGLQEMLDVSVVCLDEPGLASADIGSQSQTQRQISRAPEESDVLLHAVFENLDVVPVERPVQGSRRVAYDESNVHKLDVHLDRHRLGLLSQSGSYS